MKIIIVNKSGKKPDPLNITTPPYTPKRETLIGKIVRVIAKDIKAVALKKQALLDETPAGWEDYKRFLEMTKKK
jgi:hypothetical protein